MRGVSGREGTCTVGDTCLERAFHDLHFWESWLSVHLDLGGKRVCTREIHQPIIVLKSQSTIAARPKSGFLTSWRRASCASWYLFVSNNVAWKILIGERPGKYRASRQSRTIRWSQAASEVSVWHMMLNASIRLLPLYVYFEAHSLSDWKSHERYSGLCNHTSFAGYRILKSCLRVCSALKRLDPVL